MGDSGNTGNVPKIKFFDGVKAEFKKISWPDKQSLLKQSIAVVSVSVVLGLIITLFDTFIKYGVNILTM
ncbi:MAG: preprotein translocase subunit SecE [Lachnospiraceae bacterium]